MEISLLLAQQIVQLFLIMLAGYAVVKTGLLKAADSKVLSVILVYLVIPCMILNAFQIDDTPEIRQGLLYSVLTAAAMHIVLIALSALLRRPLKLDAIERMSVIYSNAGTLVIPLVQAILGSEYVIYSCAFVIVQTVLIWTHGNALMQGSGAFDWKRILKNINIIAIIAGAVMYALHLTLPAILQNTVSSMGSMIGPAGMLLAGMAIAESPLREVFCTRRNYIMAADRLLLCPAIILALLWLFRAQGYVPDGKNILMTVYLAAVTPVCATITSMAQLYNKDAAHSSALYVVTTLISIVTMPVMIGVYDTVIK